MCKVYNSVGSLRTVKTHLGRHNITEFKSIKDVIAFQNDYGVIRETVIKTSEKKIEAEKRKIALENVELQKKTESTKEAVTKELEAQLENLQNQLQFLMSSQANNVLQKWINYFRTYSLRKKIRSSERSLPHQVSQSVHSLVETYEFNQDRLNYITNRFEDAVTENCSFELSSLERKRSLIDEVRNSIYGAIGEQKVVRELERLSDEHFLINDFCLSFNPPIYNRSENDHIMSIQVDHLLVAPSGVFLIETKNWSEQSLNSLSLRSPVSQLRRSSFALFIVLNDVAAGLTLEQHHWGKRKIPLKNLLVLTNQKLQEEFQYVKVLTLQELYNYIRYFPPVFTPRETESIANKLINLSRR